MIRVLHIITGLERGGAETMLANMLATVDRTQFLPSVISLTDLGLVARDIRALGIEVEAINMPRRLSIGAIVRLVRAIRRHRPDIVQTWMYHANVVGALAARLAGIRAIVWGIHATQVNFQNLSGSTAAIIRAGAWLSPNLAQTIVCCSLASFRDHMVAGFAVEKLIYIPNGFDVERFRPDRDSYVGVRRELGLAPDAQIVGYVARFDPQKDHETFFAAAAALSRAMPDAHFLLCGNNIDPGNAELAGLISAAGVTDRCHLLGVRKDMPRLTAAFDIATVSSAYGEAFPLAIGEAMASAVPCVVTNVGDSARIVADTGITVAPRDPDSLAHSWAELLSMPADRRHRLGELARTRIVEEFPIENSTRQYGACYRDILSGTPQRKSADANP
jgi:glycosyltransferase involved in cell wall biosynthesis